MDLIVKMVNIGKRLNPKTQKAMAGRRQRNGELARTAAEQEPSPLVARVIGEVSARIANGRLVAGQHLTVQAFQVEFDVSKSPVLRALENLADAGLLRREPNRGFFVASHLRGRVKSPDLPQFLSDEAHYMRLADDRLAGLLPDRVTESELMRRYDLTRAGVGKILDRASGEGWLVRRPGQGWTFLPMLDSSDALAQSYRFRMAIEPAALVEPTFQVDAKAFDQFRDSIAKMADGDLARMSRAEIFDIGSSFHEMLMKCSGNEFFLSAIRRINRLRRLVEYRKAIDSLRLMRESREHLVLLDMLEKGNREEASIFMRQHLAIALRAKAQP